MSAFRTKGMLKHEQSPGTPHANILDLMLNFDPEKEEYLCKPDSTI